MALKYKDIDELALRENALGDEKIAISENEYITPDVITKVVRKLIEDLKTSIPTDNNELQNGAGYITSDVDNLLNYLPKTEIEALVSALNEKITRVEGSVPTDNAELSNGAGYATTEEVNEKITEAVPTDNNQLANGAGYITRTVIDLLNYYSKAQTYTRDEIKALVNAVTKITFEKVDVLPEVGEANVIYLLKNGSVYDEYIYIDGAWDVIGSTDVDLSNYYNKQEVDNLLALISQEIQRVSESVPTDNKSLTNGAGYITKDVTNLANYPKTTEVDKSISDLKIEEVLRKVEQVFTPQEQVIIRNNIGVDVKEALFRELWAEACVGYGKLDDFNIDDRTVGERSYGGWSEERGYHLYDVELTYDQAKKIFVKGKRREQSNMLSVDYRGGVGVSILLPMNLHLANSTTNQTISNSIYYSAGFTTLQVHYINCANIPNFGLNNNLTHVYGMIQYATSAAHTSPSPFVTNCVSLRHILLYNLCQSLDYSVSKYLENISILCMVKYARVDLDIEIKLHPDAYSRAMADAAIQAALLDKPRLTLV